MEVPPPHHPYNRSLDHQEDGDQTMLSKIVRKSSNLLPISKPEYIRPFSIIGLGNSQHFASSSYKPGFLNETGDKGNPLLSVNCHWCPNLFQRMNYCAGTIKVIKSKIPDVPLPTEPFHDILLTSFKTQMAQGKNKIAFYSVDGQKQITFQQLYDASLSMATFLYHNGFKKGDIAMVVLPNVWQYIPIFLGVLKAGGAISGANPAFTEAELCRQMKDSNAKVVYTNEEWFPKVEKAIHEAGCVKTVIVIPRSKSSHVPEDIVNFFDSIKTPFDSSIQFPSIDIEKDLCFLPFSSGTSGVPKGVMLTHKNFGSMAAILKSHEQNYISTQLDPNWDYENERALHVLPMFHMFGFAMAILNLLNGSGAVLIRKFDPNVFCSAIEQHKIRSIFVVPPVLVFLAKHPTTAQYDLSSIEHLTSGAAPAGKDICDEVMEKYKNIKYITQSYGLTECTSTAHQPNLRDGYVVGSVGQLVGNMQMRVIDVDTEEDVEPGTRGEICLKGPAIMLGYLNKPEQTAEALRDGWLHTGDIGYVDETGNLHIVDRLKEMIKVKGYQVAPAELEGILLTNRNIVDVAVIAVPNERTGEAPRAYIVRRTESLTASDVHDFMKGKVSRHKLLTGGIQFVRQIPKSAAGKILRRLLRESYAEKKK